MLQGDLYQLGLDLVTHDRKSSVTVAPTTWRTFPDLCGDELGQEGLHPHFLSEFVSCVGGRRVVTSCLPLRRGCWSSPRSTLQLSRERQEGRPPAEGAFSQVIHIPQSCELG